MIILHLSHTDIKSDSRILKEMNSLLKLEGDNKIYGIGIKDVNSRTVADSLGLEIESLELASKKYNYFFRPLRYLLIYIEIFLRMLISAFNKKPDVIHCHDVVVLPVALLAKLLSGAKLVYDAHELESQKNGNTRFLSKLILLVEKISWRSISALIVVSPSIDTWYGKNLGKKRTEVILNAPIVNFDSHTKSSQYLREYFNIPQDKKIFLYVGLLTKGRGLDLLLKVFQRKEVESHLVFLGYGELFEGLIEASKSNFKIHAHKAVPHDKVTEIASSADYGLCLIQNVSLSDYYCLPNKLFEYSFAGVRVLASNFPEISAVVHKYNLGECVDLDEGDILRAVLKLEKEEVLTRNVSENVYRDLSWKTQESKLLSLYNSL